MRMVHASEVPFRASREHADRTPALDATGRAGSVARGLRPVQLKTSNKQHATLRNELAASGQSLLAGNGQILVAAHTGENQPGRVGAISLDRSVRPCSQARTGTPELEPTGPRVPDRRYARP
jgi:hypothetical protein